VSAMKAARFFDAQPKQTTVAALDPPDLKIAG
jgi:hypothetical protein